MNTASQRPDSAGSFLPDEYVSKRAELRAGILGMGLFCVVMVLVVGAFIVTNQRWRAVRSEARAVEVEYEEQRARIEQLEKLETEREDMLEKAEIVSALVEKTPRSLMMAEIVGRMPPGMTLLEVKLDGKRIEAPKPEEAKGKKGPQKVGTLSKTAAKPADKSKTKGKGDTKTAAKEPAPPPRERIAPPKFDYRLTLGGVTTVNTEVADFLARLKECDFLQNADLVYIRETDIDGKELRKFEIIAQLRTTTVPPKAQVAEVETDKASGSNKE